MQSQPRREHGCCGCGCLFPILALFILAAAGLYILGFSGAPDGSSGLSVSFPSSESTDSGTSSHSHASSFTRYYYKQLNDCEKEIYDAVADNRKAMRSGTARIPLGDACEAVLEEDEDAGSQTLYRDFERAVNAYLQDNPRIFYLNISGLYLNVETTTFLGQKSYDVYLNTKDNSSYLSKPYNTEDQVIRADKKLRKVRNRILKDASDDPYENIVMVHDYLVSNVEYSDEDSRSCHTAYGALVQGEAVCDGYAKAFQYLMQALDYRCVLISGSAVDEDGYTENHAWNYVRLDGEWYAVDCTWDDPVYTNDVSEALLSRSVRTNYLLKGSKTFSKDHTPNRYLCNHSEPFRLPSLSEEDYPEP